MSKKRIIISWILTVLIGGLLCSVLEDYLYHSSFFSIFELGLLISIVAAGAGLIPLLASLYIQNSMTRNGQSDSKITIYNALVQSFFASLFIIGFLIGNEANSIYFTLIFLALGVLISATRLLSTARKK